MNKKKKLILLIFVVLAIVLVLIFIPKKKAKKEQEVIIEDKIEKYDYTLDDNETAYYKKLFNELKEVLNADTLDEEAYAKLISQLFIADFFNLDNKLSNSDIGGLQFVYKDYQETFSKFAKDGIYHIVKSNLYGDREQQLPIVTEVVVNNIEQSNITYLEEEDSNGYIIDLKILYQEDLGYQTTASLYLAHTDNKLEIIKMTK